jgi:hypothetical protein
MKGTRRVILSLALTAVIPFSLLAEGGAKSPAKKGRRATQTAPAAGAQTQTAPAEYPRVQTDQGVTVRENYFMALPGIDLSTLTPKQKQRFLDRVNEEFCTCGCPRDTIARCLVNDPKCSTVRGLAEKILSDVKAGQ